MWRRKSGPEGSQVPREDMVLPLDVYWANGIFCSLAVSVSKKATHSSESGLKRSRIVNASASERRRLCSHLLSGSFGSGQQRKEKEGKSGYDVRRANE
ncbi:hypothetical protein PDE_08421 [Penicillium oxalicum 114-2]|uniref:Uncharacterized protein n=1 Tax=Penicillium oxalicum (strain 114-2 / CGMCC 5302) TaxID=933388 RepID=S7ZSR6_PENO1|nr:hypothetical protein PDE_08421 [Penicillium oxalicum 114-2]